VPGNSTDFVIGIMPIAKLAKDHISAAINLIGLSF